MPARSPAAAVICGVFLICAAYAPPAHAQPPSESSGSDEPRRLLFGLSFLGTVPSGDFADHVGTGGGVLLHFDRRLGESVFSLGGEVGVAIYGSETREVALGSLIPEMPHASAKVKTENLIGFAHALVRAQHRWGSWQPYADGLLGITGLETDTTIEASRCDSDDCTLDGETNAQDLAFSYGVGGGVMFGPPGLVLDLSVRYIRGAEASYLAKGAIRRQGGNAILDFSRSRTDVFTVNVGVMFGR